jgi:hypothetical protein
MLVDERNNLRKEISKSAGEKRNLNEKLKELEERQKY